MYIDSLSFQTCEFLYSFGFGFILGLLWFLSKIIRNIIYGNKKRSIVTDVIFAISASFLSILFSLGVCRGKFAFYVVFGMASGFVTYLICLGSLSDRFAKKSADLFCFVFKSVTKFLKSVGKKIYFLFSECVKKSKQKSASKKIRKTIAIDEQDGV